MDPDKQLNYYRLDPETVIKQLDSHDKGLSDAEAKVRLERIGANELHEVKREWFVVTFLRQFKNTLVIMLLVSAAVSLYLHDRRTALILLIISLVNAGIGFFEEHKAETLMESLQKLVVPQAKALRDGKLEEIYSSELVIGDIVYIEEGDSVPADLRVIDEDELATNDFALTGESAPSRKFVHAINGDVILGNRHNLLFMGTTVATGHGHGIVIGTGMHTELGRIANLSESTTTDASPLQKEMSNLASRIAQATIILAAILTIIALRANLGIHAALLFAIGIAAAMIPNGLVAEVSITLAQSAGRMARERALVKTLSAVETLGATTIIATDKTGTLTKNEMTVEQLLIGKTTYAVTGTGYETNGTVVDASQKPLDAKTLKELELFFVTGALASNARISPPDAEHATWYCLGDPTEGALITLTRKAGLDPDKLTDDNKELKEFQFDSARKRMSSVRHWNNQTVVFVKGAPESVLERSSKLWEHGQTKKLSTKDREFFLKYNEGKAHEAMRNLGFAYRILPHGSDPRKMKFDEVEKDLTFLGIVSMVDPLREEVPLAMEAARLAHIKVSIVTGDFPTTAEAIARKAGLVGKDEEITVVLGEELPGLADTQILQLVLRGGVVFSRVAPEDKLRIVDLVKQHGQVVAVTGDGINDAPALKRADIGVAMGKVGTDVAKQAAGIVLLDDSFSTLINAIEQGRLTFQNIKKAARCALTDNMGELMAVLISLAGQALFHVPMAITAIQILAIDLVAQLAPITALGWDSPEGDLMTEKPRNLRDHIVNLPAAIEFVGYGLLSASLAYLNFLFFFIRHNVGTIHISMSNPWYGKATMLTYLTIVLCQFMNLLLVRSSENDKFFSKYLFSNKKLLAAFAFSFCCILLIMYNPAIRPYLGAGPLTFSDWLWAFLAAILYSSVRLFQRYTSKHSRHAVIQLHHKVHGTKPATAKA